MTETPVYCTRYRYTSIRTRRWDMVRYGILRLAPTYFTLESSQKQWLDRSINVRCQKMSKRAEYVVK